MKQALGLLVNKVGFKSNTSNQWSPVQSERVLGKTLRGVEVPLFVQVAAMRRCCISQGNSQRRELVCITAGFVFQCQRGEM